MKIAKSEVQPGIWEIALTGNLTIDSATELENTVMELLSEKATAVYLNLEATRHIDSSGFGTIVRLMNNAKSRTVQFVLYNMRDGLREIVRSARLDRFLSIATQEEVRKLIHRS